MTHDSKTKSLVFDWIRAPLPAALLDTVASLLLSTASFTLGALALFWLGKANTYQEALMQTYARGELWIFATAFIGPSLLLLGKDSSEYTPPKFRAGLVFVVAALLVVCSFGFGYSKSIGYLGISVQAAVEFSIYCSLLAVLFRWAVLFSINSREKIDAAGLFRSEQDSFLKAYESRRGG